MVYTVLRSQGINAERKELKEYPFKVFRGGVAIIAENGEYNCEVFGKEISKEEHESYDGLCWECWDDKMTEECEFEEGII